MQTFQLPHAENMLNKQSPEKNGSQLTPSKTHECWHLQHFGACNATKLYRHERKRSLLLLLLLLLASHYYYYYYYYYYYHHDYNDDDDDDDEEDHNEGYGDDHVGDEDGK